MSLSVQELIQAQATAIHAACWQLSGQRMEGLRRGVEQACLLPGRFDWDRKAAAHAEIFTMLADAVRDPVLRQVLKSGAGLAHHLMMAAGPAADDVIRSCWGACSPACGPVIPAARPTNWRAS